MVRLCDGSSCVSRAILCGGGPAMESVEILQRTTHHPFAMSSAVVPAVYMLTCIISNKRPPNSQLRGRSGGQQWQSASAGQAHWSPDLVRQGGIWVGVGG